MSKKEENKKEEVQGLFMDSEIKISDRTATITFPEDSFNNALKESGITVKTYNKVEKCKSEYLDKIVDSSVNQLKDIIKNLDTVEVSAPFGNDNKYEAMIQLDQKTKKVTTVSKVDINFDNQQTFNKEIEKMMHVE